MARHDRATRQWRRCSRGTARNLPMKRKASSRRITSVSGQRIVQCVPVRRSETAPRYDLRASRAPLTAVSIEVDMKLTQILVDAPVQSIEEAIAIMMAIDETLSDADGVK